ncbi:MAG: pilus assembly protein PilP [Mariprofundaceae bacterium]
MTYKLTAGLAMFMAVWLIDTPSSVAAAAVEAPAKTTPVTLENKAKSELPSAATHRIETPKVDIVALRDPFESYLAVIERKNRAQQEEMHAKKSQRPHEPLEKFDLSALKLVAVMKMGDSHAAMVEDSEGKGYVLRKGSYIGRDSGRVVSISARNVMIMEEVLSPTGESVKRKVTLTLNEVN